MQSLRQRFFGVSILATLLILPTPARSADRACDALVLDGAEVLGSQLPAVEAQARAIQRAGIDPRIRTVGPTTNLDFDEARWVEACPSWQSALFASRRKSTLVVLMVSPESRKMGLYYGEAWERHLGAHWARIKTEAMGPRLRDGDYAGAFLAALQQLEARIIAAQDEALHPVVAPVMAGPTVIHEATNYAPFLGTMLWVLVGAGLLVGSIAVVLYVRRRQDDRATLQQEAIVAANEVTGLLAQMDRQALPAHQQTAYDAVVVAFSDFRLSGQGDPQVNGLRASAYRVMKRRYERMAADMKDVPYVRVPRARARTKQGRKAQQYVQSSTTLVNNTVVASYISIAPSPSSPSVSSSDESHRGQSSSSSYDSGSSGSGGSSSYDSGSSGGGGSSSYDSGSSGGGGGSSDY